MKKFYPLILVLLLAAPCSLQAQRATLHRQQRWNGSSAYLAGSLAVQFFADSKLVKPVVNQSGIVDRVKPSNTPANHSDSRNTSSGNAVSSIDPMDPVITSFSPMAAAYRDTVIINGRNFVNVTDVMFAGQSPIYLKVVNDSTIITVVPTTTSGSVIVQTATGFTTAPGFTYIPYITFAHQPSYGPPGTIVTISGGPFNPDPAANKVYFGGVAAAIPLTATGAKLTVAVPVGAVSGEINVRANGSSGYSYRHFLVTESGETPVERFRFAKATAIDSSSDARGGVAAADFDGDGKTDVVSINRHTSKVAIYRNISATAQVGFAPKLELPVGGYPVELIAGDVDMDGKPDIIVKTMLPGQIVVFRNTSSGTAMSFGAGVSVAAFVNNTGFPPYYGRRMAMKDVDGDSKPDIVSVNGQQRFSVFRNTSSPGAVSLATGIDMPCDAYASTVIMEDLDGDQKVDLAILSSGAFFTTFRNNGLPGSISFVDPKHISASATIFSLTAGDFDGDGQLDLAAATIVTRRLTLFANTSVAGNITFAPKIERSLIDYPLYIDKGDFDNDGKPDWLVLNSHSTKSMAVSANLSTPGNIVTSFAQDVEVGLISEQSFIADLNGDGLPDILAADYNGNGLFYIKNNLQDPVISSFHPSAAETGDTLTIKGRHFAGVTGVQFGGVTASSFIVLNDTTIRAVLGNGASGNVVVFTNQAQAEKDGFIFGLPPMITSYTPIAGPAGTPVAIAGKRFSPVTTGNIVYFGSVRATVTNATDSLLQVIVPAGATNQSVTVTTGGKTAYATRGFTLTFAGGSTISHQLFSVDTSIDSYRDPGHVLMGDFNSDGLNDLVTTNNKNQVMTMFTNRSKPDYSSLMLTNLHLSSGYPTSVALGDMDGDGKIDVVFGTTHFKSIGVLRNNTTQEWVEFNNSVFELEAGTEPSAVAVADLNGDGRPDIVTACPQDKKLFILLNKSTIGKISFQPAITLNTGYSPRIVAARDINGDGITDLVAAGDQGHLTSFINIVNDNELTFETQTAQFPGGNITSLTVGDIDGDGKPDMSIGRDSSNIVTILKNNSTTTPVVLAAALHIPVTGWVTAITMGDLNGDAKEDLIVSTGSKALVLLENASSQASIQYLAADTLLCGDSSLYCTAIGDFDGDAIPDIVAADGVARRLVIIKNRMAQGLIVASGSHPVSGAIMNFVTIDPVVQTHLGQAYVQRHYDITPVNNAATATATITLYFTQQDFDNYNAHTAHGLDLPHGPADAFNKANLRVYKYHGFSTTGKPASYSGNGIEIDPDDAKIVWNTVTQQWEVTFDVNGFSGFFVSSVNSAMLPVTLLSFTGQVKDEQVLLQWKTTDQLNVARFELQRRDQHSEFVTIAQVKPIGNQFVVDYDYTDAPREAPVYQYRLKIVDEDQSVTYSQIVTVRKTGGSLPLSLRPNPATDFVVVQHAVSDGKAMIRIVDMHGKTIRSVRIGANQLQTRLPLAGIPKGPYTLALEQGGERLSQLLIVR
ncbi:FG-GAP-like repeat-containing protein [Paraflavitalea pollutisoli]|uniref:FG-GAP-like repeat-containing protein n=1 Tax=Paraflavitalea pollutisoli TaxID=3034143 RepID=UPI0023ED5A06|nr:FG-GAP-like repeat-containing protein [Paraflavitalea sp. H1-2-19X]